MKVEIAVPQLGPNMFEVTVVTWLKGVGDVVAKGDVIAEVMTDKVNIDVEAPVDGVLAEVLAQAGDVVEIDRVLGSIEAASNERGVADAPAA